MNLTTDAGLISLIDSYVLPVAVEFGFVRVAPHKFVRIRGEMIDVLSVIRMRGTQLHYCGFFSNLLSKPTGRVVKSIVAGQQVTNNIESGLRWEATSDFGHQSVFEDMQDFIAGYVVKFFDGMTVRAYMEHMRYVTSMYMQSECMCLVILDESLNLIPEHCKKDLKTLAFMSVDDYTPEDTAEYDAIIKATEEAYQDGTLKELIYKRKLKNLVEAKLHKNADVVEQAGLTLKDFDELGA